MRVDIYDIVGSNGKSFAVPAGTDVENPTNLPEAAQKALAGVGNVTVRQKDRDLTRLPLPGTMQAEALKELQQNGIYGMQGSVGPG